METDAPVSRNPFAWLARECSRARRSILAIASMTFKDALRKKALVTVLLFAVLVGVTAFLPWVKPEYRLQQMTRICLAGIGFFGMIVAIFLSAPNLPDDISRKTIFTVLTKPARRWHILAGKVLGLAYLLAIMLAVMGAMAYGFISFWGWKMGGGTSSGLPLLQGHMRTYAHDIRYGTETLNVSQPMIDSERAIASGFERITFNFTDLAKKRFSGDTIYVEIILFSHGFSFDSATNQGTGLFQARNPSTGQLTSQIFGAESQRPLYIGFPRSMIDEDGNLSIVLITRLRTGNYSAMAKSVSVLSQPSTYTMNFIKALTLMFMQYMVLVFIATAASTFLTSTVSVITALFIYFTGSLTEIIRSQALKLGAETDIFTMAEHSHEAMPRIHADSLHLAANYLLRYFYLGISVVFPNLSSFSPSAVMTASEYISPAALLGGLGYGAIYAGLAFVIAWAVFSCKEVA